MKNFVVERLEQLTNLFKQRGEQYGDSYRRTGHVMAALFPNGVVLKTVSDYNRFGNFSMIVNKVVRYANNFSNGGHEDSLDDISVYAVICQDLDKNKDQ